MSREMDVCPVCGMKADAGVSSVEYLKMYFHFCSAQCREMFVAHPNLYSSKVGKEREKIIKQRTMRLAEPIGEVAAELLSSYLMELMGVKDVQIKGNQVSITYDLMEITEKKIEQVFLEAGMALGGGWLGRFRRAWIHDSEENELANLATPPRSYTHIPPKV